MANTLQAQLVGLSQRIYKEWIAKTVLVQSCDRSFEGEFDLEKNEIDIPVYHDLSVHKTTLKERELKPAPLEFMKSSTIRVTVDKGRYSHWGHLKISTIVERLSQEDSETRKKLVNKWARDAEDELALWVAGLPSRQEIDLSALLVDDTKNPNGLLTPDNIVLALDILKAKIIEKNMEVADFRLFTSERFRSVARDAKILTGANLDANEPFRKGFVDIINGIKIYEHECAAITTRSADTGLVIEETAIWKSTDGIQYVVPYKNTIAYDIPPTEVLMGAKGYQTVEYYDFFNLYPTRLYKVKIKYAASS